MLYLVLLVDSAWYNLSSSYMPGGVRRFWTDERPKIAWMVAGSASEITTPGSKKSSQSSVPFVYTQADKKFVIFLFPNIVYVTMYGMICQHGTPLLCIIYDLRPRPLAVSQCPL